MKKTQSLLLIPFILLLLLTPNTEAAGDDSDIKKLTANPVKWPTSDVSIPFGLILSLNKPAYYIEVSEVYGEKNYAPDILRFGVGFYYESWQLSYKQIDYGSVVNIMARSIGQDVYRGVYLEIGSGPDYIDRSDNKNNNVSSVIYGLGITSNSGFDDGVSFYYGYDLVAGIISANEDHLYSSGGIKGGIRLPFDHFSAIIFVNGQFVTYPNMSVLYPPIIINNNSRSESYFLLKVDINLSISLNLFQK